MYEVIYDPKAIEFLEKLPKEIGKRIFNKIILAKENPFHFFERLSERTEYKLRVGDYRVIADIFQKDKRIHVTFIGHRRNVYHRMQN